LGQNFIIWQQKERIATLTKDFLEKKLNSPNFDIPLYDMSDYIIVGFQKKFTLLFIL
jgi:hypothetical protein